MIVEYKPINEDKSMTTITTIKNYKDITWMTYAQGKAHETTIKLNHGLRGRITTAKAGEGKHLRVFHDYTKDCSDMHEVIYETTANSLINAKKAFFSFYINYKPIEVENIEVATLEVIETATETATENIEETEINLNDILGEDIIDEQLFADDSIDNIIGVDAIDSQLFPTIKGYDVNIDDLIAELGDDVPTEMNENEKDWYTLITLTAIEKIIPVGFKVLKSEDWPLNPLARNPIIQIIIGGENRLTVIQQRESLEGVDTWSVMRLIEEVINNPDEVLLFGKDIKVDLA
jgi:hypothetical protein